MDIQYLQGLLDKSKKLSEKFDRNINLLLLEKKYQEYINKFSPAYLSGSPLYVGPSLLAYIEKQHLNTDYLAFLFLISNKLDKEGN